MDEAITGMLNGLTEHSLSQDYLRTDVRELYACIVKNDIIFGDLLEQAMRMKSRRELGLTLDLLTDADYENMWLRVFGLIDFEDKEEKPIAELISNISTQTLQVYPT